jgi:polyhydroxyalkanoate synthesis regulator phasin
MQSTGDETLASESLKRMFDPEFFAFAALDEASGSVQRMAEGPEFADIGFLEKHMLQSTAEWFAMREADAKYRQVTGAAWARAFQRFTSEMSSDWSRYSGDSRKVLDRWLEIANDELIKTQRQDDYLDASRKLFRATIEYRLKQRELTEIWCESQSIPTRTEVDDLHRTVTELRREVRALKRQHAGATTATSAPARSKKPGKKVAAAKKSARTRRNVAKAVKRNGDQDSADAGDVTVRDVAVKARSVRKKRAAKKATGKKSDAKNDPSPQSLDD